MGKRRSETTEYPVEALTPGQDKLVAALNSCNNGAQNQGGIIAIHGPAGTGKTFVAATHGAWLYAQKHVKKIVVTRPTIPIEKTVGFLPGTAREKMEAWVAPITAPMKEILGKGEGGGTWKCDLDKKILLLPLEHIRGYTFDDAFVILDEAQNCSYAEMKAFLTRIGEGTTMVVCGDTSQTDLRPNGRPSGLQACLDLLSTEGIRNSWTIEFDERDIVRSDIAADVVKGYISYENQNYYREEESEQF